MTAGMTFTVVLGAGTTSAVTLDETLLKMVALRTPDGTSSIPALLVAPIQGIF